MRTPMNSASSNPVVRPPNDTRRCPMCGDANYTPYYRLSYAFLRDRHHNDVKLLDLILGGPEGAFELVNCRSCRMLYTLNNYNLAEIRERLGLPFDTPLNALEFKKEAAGMDPERFFIAYHIVERLMRLTLNEGNTETRFLDFGGGQVGFHSRLANIYARASCVAYDPIINEADIDGIRFTNDLAKLRAWGPFDAIACNEVLEHALDPRRETKAIFELLKPGGIAFLGVPLLRYNRLDSFRAEIEAQTGVAAKIVHINHINYFSLKLFADLVRQEGFEILPFQLNPLAYKSSPLARGFPALRAVSALRWLGFRASVALGAYNDFTRHFMGSLFVRRPA